MSDPSDYEEQWQELDEKTIMVQCLMELQQIRMTLQDTQSETRTTERDTYECDRCGATVMEDERQDHAITQHKCPPDMAETMFTEQ
jgi:hypothetical protein